MPDPGLGLQYLSRNASAGAWILILALCLLQAVEGINAVLPAAQPDRVALHIPPRLVVVEIVVVVNSGQRDYALSRIHFPCSFSRTGSSNDT